MGSEQQPTDGFEKPISEIIGNIDAHARRIQQIASVMRTQFAPKRVGSQIIIDPDIAAIKKMYSELQLMTAGLDEALREYKNGL